VSSLIRSFFYAPQRKELKRLRRGTTNAKRQTTNTKPPIPNIFCELLNSELFLYTAEKGVKEVSLRKLTMLFAPLYL
jgi:hypothetical protein